jgi:conserved domain protein
MTLITKQLEKELAKYPLYSQDSKGDNAIAVCKFFLQGYTWYVLEAEKNGDDYEFYGITVGQFAELGYFTLSQLESVTGQWGLRVERDRGFKPTKVKDLHLDIV